MHSVHGIVTVTGPADPPAPHVAQVFSTIVIGMVGGEAMSAVQPHSAVVRVVVRVVSVEASQPQTST